jgi:hypothetical protein
VSEWILVAGTAVGAVIGIAGTLGAQILANHAERGRNLAVRDEAKRAELRTYIDQFVRATQLAEEAAARHQDDATLKGHAFSEMWIAYKSLSFVSDAPLQEAAWAFCDVLNSCLWEPTDEAPWPRIKDPLYRFQDATTEALRHP